MPRTPAKGVAEGWRSGLEEQIGAQLKKAGVPYEYETLVIPFTQPAKPRRYTPDYILLNNGIVIESKGRFQTADRQKHLLVQAQHPALDIRFVFSRANTRISKQSQTTYAMWCESNDFLYADRGIIPVAWIKEPPNTASLAAIKAIMDSRRKKK